MGYECRKCGHIHPKSFVVCPRYAQGTTTLVIGVSLAACGVFFAFVTVMDVTDSEGALWYALLRGAAALFYLGFGTLILREYMLVRRHPEIARNLGPLDHMRFCSRCGRAFVPPAATCVDCGYSLQGIT
ncbi:MAG: hypothetical protein JW880_02285 [Candidatus Thermoplasmatota archaeon]|nr:hypothetical protein [Candidatus Thermoplasmatota archaeon]